MSEAREIAEHQLEVAIKDVLADELESCWSRFKEDSAIDDPEDQMEDLADWFGEQIKTLISEIIEQDPLDSDYDDYEDDDDEDEDEDDPEDDGVPVEEDW